MSRNSDSDDHVRRRPGHFQSNTMCVVVVLCCYLVPFALVLFDAMLFGGRFIAEPLRTYNQDVCDRIGEAFQFVYWPLLEVMRQLKFLPT